MTVTTETNTTQTGTGNPPLSNIRTLPGVGNVTIAVTNGAHTDNYTLTPAAPLYGLHDFEDEMSSSGDITRNTAKFVYNGTEAWSNSYGWTAETSFVTQKTSTVPYGARFLCSHFTKQVIDVASPAGLVEITSTGYAKISIEKSRIGNPANNAEAIAGFKAWLATQNSASTPVTFVYALTTPVLDTFPPLVDITALSGKNTVSSGTGNAVSAYYNKDSVAMHNMIDRYVPLFNKQTTNGDSAVIDLYDASSVKINVTQNSRCKTRVYFRNDKTTWKLLSTVNSNTGKVFDTIHSIGSYLIDVSGYSYMKCTLTFLNYTGLTFSASMSAGAFIVTSIPLLPLRHK